jgi:hypothetical protein
MAPQQPQFWRQAVLPLQFALQSWHSVSVPPMAPSFTHLPLAYCAQIPSIVSVLRSPCMSAHVCGAPMGHIEP